MCSPEGGRWGRTKLIASPMLPLVVSQAFPQMELLIRMGEVTERMYIIRRGLCGKGGRVCTSGKYVF